MAGEGERAGGAADGRLPSTERVPSSAAAVTRWAVLTGQGPRVAMTAALTPADALRDRVVGPFGGAERFYALTGALTAVDPEPPSRPPCGG